MQVAYEVRSSQWGQGIFAAQPILTGQLVWDITRATCETYDEAEAQGLIDALRESEDARMRQVLEYSYWCPTSRRLVDVSGDDGRFFNHGEGTNVSSIARDLQAYIEAQIHSMLCSYWRENEHLFCVGQRGTGMRSRATPPAFSRPLCIELHLCAPRHCGG